MNKNLIKTVTAGVVGIAIIAGTAGTFATWQREAIQSVGSIQTGDIRVNLNLSDWTASNSAKPVRFLDDITFVPGTTATATLSGHVALEGLTLNDVQVDFDIFAGPEINVAKDGFITYR
ncbi:MAG: hypothetical protein LBB58_06040, partial [Cellulomonadaceae bacterium]|nr:hypothetical protein [Cellulomonadaceae bacterium]